VAQQIVSDSDQRDKKPYDEETLAKVLEAAYVLQEHNRRLQEQAELQAAAPQHFDFPASVSRPAAVSQPVAAAGKDDYAAILAQIVEIQQQIQTRRLPLEPAISLIVERLAAITRAAGAAIGILEGRMLRYRAAAGQMTLPPGSEVRLEKALCAASLRVGDVIRCGDVNPEFLIDAAECHRRGIEALVCVPIYHNGKIAGGLEVYYPNTHAFTEPDVHSCQLMAGLVSEAMARNEEIAWRTSAAAEPAPVADLENLKPNLAAMAASRAASRAVPPAVASTAAFATAASFLCQKCGHELVGEEQFCGQCGTPRSGDYERPTMQSKVASMLYMQEAARKIAAASAATGGHHAIDPPRDQTVRPSGKMFADRDDLEGIEDTENHEADDELPQLFRLPENVTGHVDEIHAEASDALAPLDQPAFSKNEGGEDFGDTPELMAWDEETPPAETSLVRVPQSAHWSSAVSARRFWEEVAHSEKSNAVLRFLAVRRGQIYLALALILVAAVLRWGIGSNHSVAATGKPTSVAARRTADLPFFDRLLIDLGLADPPDAPEYKGNSDTRVWIDLRSGLYYCPGADLYGKTPKGKFATQHQAQLDQFEPALRKACD
jgi:GAF domain-containing protein